MTDQTPPVQSQSKQGRPLPRFMADNAKDGTPVVLDMCHYPPRVVVGCFNDERAERIAAFLNGEFPPAKQGEGRA